MTTNIHALAVVDPKAELGSNVKIGPFCTVGPHVQLGDNVQLVSHVVVDGRTQVGEDTIIYPFASIGTAPQDLKYSGEESTLHIGKRNKIREHVTMNPGTKGDKMKTVVGDDCLFMMAAHVAHDCIVGNRVILANNATLAGHVVVGDFAIIGGLSAIHQFVRIGEHAMIGGMSGVENDVIPYGMVMGERARLAGLNLVGLERRGFEKESVQTLLKAFRELFMGDGTFAGRLADIEQRYADEELVADLVAFAKVKASRPLCQPKK